MTPFSNSKANQISTVVSPNFASCLHVENPLDVHPSMAWRVEVGVMIDTLAPDWKYPTVCLINSEPIARAAWNQPVQPGDVIAFVSVLQGGGGGSGGGMRTVLMVVAAVAIGMWNPVAGNAFWNAAVKIVVSMAVNAVIASVLPLPDAAASNGAPESSPSYTVGMQGNSVRIDAAVAEVFGCVKRTPEFVAPAYNLYVDHDQYYHALLMIGRGEYDVHLVRIDDTPINAFQDIQYQIIPPGSSPSLVASNVITAVEVTGQELLTNQYVGPFVACKAGFEAQSLGVDLICPYGLSGPDGSARSATVRIDCRLIDDYERPLGAWTELATETVTAATTKVQRVSYTYSVAQGRYMVRAVRTDIKEDSTQVAHEVQWGSLRVHLANAAVSLPDCTLLEVRIRATDQLNGMSQRQINAIVTRKLPRWTGSAWTAPEATRSIAWAAAYIMRDAPGGVTIEDDRLDLAGLLELDALWAQRQDRFDWIFDSGTTAWDALTLCLRAGRAVPMLRGSITTVFRDGPQDLPVALWSPRNIKAGTLTLSMSTTGDQTPDGVIVEYWDNKAWDWREVVYPVASNPVRPQRMRLPGIAGRNQAQREAAYIYADHLYRTERVTWTATRDGLLPAYGSLCLVAHDLPEWGEVSGDVVSYIAASRVIELTEPPAWTAGTVYYIRLTSPTGDVTAPIQITRGADDFHAVLASGPGIALITDDPTRERSRYVVGGASDVGEPVIIRAIRPRKWEEVELEAVVEDARVHTADNAWLPAPGEVQDAPTDGTGVDVDNPLPVVALQARLIDVAHEGAMTRASLQLGAGGTLIYGDHTEGVWGGQRGGAYAILNNEWLNPGPQPASVAAKYEVQVLHLSMTAPYNASALTGDATGVWLPLSGTRIWEQTTNTNGSAGTPDYYGESLLQVQIRKIGTTDLLADVQVTLKSTSTAPEYA